MPEVIIVDAHGQEHIFPDGFDPKQAAAIVRQRTAQQEPPQPSGGPTAALIAARSAPTVARATTRPVAGFVARHPALTQKVIGAGASTAAGGTGAAIGGVPGAVVGASIRGVTPAQTTIREVAGRWAGEAPAVSRDAAKALAIQNYAKETSGLRLRPTDIIPKPTPANALEHYANSMERGILRLYGPHGEVVSGPSAATEIPRRAATSPARRAIGGLMRIAAPLSGAMTVTDFAQAMEPTRRDIGVMGIGRTLDADDLRMSPEAYEQYRRDYPPLANLLAQKTRDALLRLLGSEP